MFTLWGSSDVAAENDKQKNTAPPYIFCGFGDAFDSFREEGRDEETPSNNSKSSDRYREDSENILQECFEDTDDSTIVSSSGVSTLSIDYNGARNFIENGKVDLSDIGEDDDSTIGSDIADHDDKYMLEEPSKDFGNKNAFQERTSIPFDYKQRSYLSSDATELNVRADMNKKDLLKVLHSKVTHHGRYSLEAAHILKALGNLHEGYGQFDDAINFYQESLDIFSSKLGDHSTEVTALQLCLARVHYSSGNEYEALKLYSRVLFIMTSESSECVDIDSADIRVSISKIIHAKGLHKEAIKELKKALKSYREFHGDEHEKVADTVDLIADFYASNGSHDKAASVRGELVKLRVALNGSKSFEVASALEKWASAHEAQGDLTAALRVMKQSYVMLHDIEGSDGPNAEKTLEKIGFLYSQMGRIDKGIKAHTSVALMRKQKYGEYSVELASSYLTLGKEYMKACQYDRALKALNRAMTCFGKANESNNDYISEIMDTLHTIGALHDKTENYNKAVETFEKEIKIRQRYMRRDHIGIINAMVSLGKAKCDLQLFSDAKASFIDALQRCDRSEGRRIKFAEILTHCGKAFEGLHDEGRAFTCFKESYQIFMANGCNNKELAPMKEVASKLLSMGLRDITSLDGALRCQIIDGESHKFEF